MWHMLGIHPTDDARQIRAAYARQLRQIDTAANPQAFVQLRVAYERALARAAGDRDDLVDAEAPSAPEPEPVPAAPSAPPEWLNDLRAIDRLVEGEQSREAIFGPVQMHLERVFTHPDMQSIDHAAQIEHWAAHRILSGIPRTNALIGPSIDHFGWADRVEDWDCPPAIHQVMQRRADNMVYATLFESDTRAGKVFRMLADPAGRAAGSASREVQQLLKRLRVEHPTILLDLPDGNVARWDALADREMQMPIARASRWLDARLARIAKPCRRLYLDRVATGIALGLAMLTLVVMTIGAPIIAFVTIRWICQLAEKFGLLFDSRDAQ